MSRNAIEFFMWGYQQHFRASIQIQAEGIFQKLEPGFEVETFLVGLVRKEDPSLHPVCIEPENSRFHPRDFLAVRSDIASFLQIDGDDGLFSTTEAGDSAIQSRRRFRAVRAAFMKALGQRFDLQDRDYYFSGVSPIGNYEVGVVLSVKHKDSLHCYKLPKSHAEDRYRVPLSIVESVAEEFLLGCLKSFYVPDPTLVDGWDTSRKEEVLREAASRLMEAPNFAARSFENLYGLFPACNYISSLTYEGGESVGAMIIAPAEHPNVEATIELVDPIRLQKYRAVRKLLEIATDGDAIISDGAFVTGFGRVVGTYDQSRSDLFLIRFTGHHKWEILHGDHSMMRVGHEVPKLATPPLNRADFISLFRVLMPDVPMKTVGELFGLGVSACKQRHGTVLIFSPSAKEEAKRLALQAQELSQGRRMRPC